MYDYIIQQFTDIYSDDDTGLFLEAFVDQTKIISSKEVVKDYYLFMVTVNKFYPFVIILEDSQQEMLYFKAFDELEQAQEFFSNITKLFFN